MKKWKVYGVITGGKFLGTVEAETKEQAEVLADSLDTWIVLCHQCSGEIDDPQITKLEVEES